MDLREVSRRLKTKVLASGLDIAERSMAMYSEDNGVVVIYLSDDSTNQKQRYRRS